MPVGEEHELERRDRALDRHVDDVHDQPAAVEPLERLTECLGAGSRVERERPLVPPGPGQPLGLLGLKARARRDDEHVVRQVAAVLEPDGLAVERDRVDRSLVERDPGMELPTSRADDLVEMRESEGHEQKTGLVDVPVVAVDDVDLGLVRLEPATQPGNGSVS